MDAKRDVVLAEKYEAPVAPPGELAGHQKGSGGVVAVAAVDESGKSPGSPSAAATVAEPEPEPVVPRFTVFTPRQKRLIVLSAAFSALFASWTAQVYLPALAIAAADLRVSIAKINFTVTSYMILQGVTPVFVGGLADVAGRRPAYLACFLLYIVANAALAKSDSYGSLLGLRCFQSATISATQALCQGVVADIATAAERGQYTALVAMPVTLGPSLGPVIGGAIAQYLGWRAIFLFLAACAAANIVILVGFFPETCRNVVGDGSALPPRSNRTVWQLLRYHRRRNAADDAESGSGTAPPSPNPDRPGAPPPPKAPRRITFAWSKLLTSLVLLVEKELGLLFLYGGFVFAGVYAVATAVPSLFAAQYGFDGLQTGLIYLPMAAGSLASVALVGRAMNWNFARHARRLGLRVDRAREADLADFPIERARVEVAAPALLLSAIVITAWGWAVEGHAHVAVVCVLVFLLGLGLVSAVSVFNALIADVRPGKTGAASAANNIIKFLLASAMAAAIEPLILAVGPGKAYSIIAVLYLIFSPCLYLLVVKGVQWRKELRQREGGNAD
ncbi:MFS general substrate transporter [Durotheca rogersii]|uniref:MFS general substrate transporter n=1 Tax=Durotheca rogersii TaxID=419775 RepID=UPI002220CD55|nr:MFS general substrate transporter [Durotheca rogersii]KAI5863032.1 MFS general substrate transporter [Durotheca rogersii]